MGILVAGAVPMGGQKKPPKGQAKLPNSSVYFSHATKMIVFVPVSSWDELPTGRTKAVVGLKWDNWDDFGFRTTFHAQIQLPGEKLLDLGVVKILSMDQTGGKTLISGRFTELQDNYCSLGQSLAYYEMLRKLGPWYRDYLEAMKDVVYSPVILESFRDQRGFSDSLVRSGGASIALEDAPSLFLQSTQEQSSMRPDQLACGFQTKVGGTAFRLSIHLTAGELQERCAVLNGYNATGKLNS